MKNHVEIRFDEEIKFGKLCESSAIHRAVSRGQARLSKFDERIRQLKYIPFTCVIPNDKYMYANRARARARFYRHEIFTPVYIATWPRGSEWRREEGQGRKEDDRNSQLLSAHGSL